MLAAVTLLPALLGFVGTRIDRLGLPHRRKATRPGRTTFWYRWSRTLQRRPGRAAAVGFVVLLVLAAPALSMRLGIGDAGNLRIQLRINGRTMQDSTTAQLIFSVAELVVTSIPRLIAPVCVNWLPRMSATALW